MSRSAVLFTAVWSLLTIASLSIGQLHEWPDFVHVRYGFPLTYAVHTISTIAGPADFWFVDINMLVVNMTLYASGLVAGIALLTRRRNKKSE